MPYIVRKKLLLPFLLIALCCPQLAYAICTGPNYTGGWNSMFTTAEDDGTYTYENIDTTLPTGQGPQRISGLDAPSPFGCQPAGYNQATKRLITTSLCNVQEKLGDISFRIYCIFQHYTQPIFMALLTIYISLMGVAYILRLTTPREAIPQVIKMVIVAGLVLNPQNYYELVYSTTMGMLRGLSEAMMEAMPARDINSNLVYDCPPGVPNIGDNDSQQCTPFVDCVDINIINPAYLSVKPYILPNATFNGQPLTFANTPSPTIFGKYLAQEGGQIVPGAGAPSASSSGRLDPTRDALGWKLLNGDDVPYCKNDAQKDCILDCGTKGPKMLQEEFIKQKLIEACEGEATVNTTCPEAKKLAVLKQYACAYNNTPWQDPVCWPVVRRTIPHASVFESYDALFYQIVGHSFLSSAVAYMIAISLSFLGIGAIIAILAFIGLVMALWMFVRLFIMFLTSILAIAFILMFGPIFIPMALFGWTQPIFKRWLGSIVTHVMQPILILAFLLFISELMSIQNFVNGLGTRGMFLIMDEYNLFADIKPLTDLVNLDTSFTAPKFLFIKEDENPKKNGRSFDTIPFTLNIQQQPYYDYVKRISTLEGGNNPATTNEWNFLGLFQFGESALGSSNVYGCTGEEGGKLPLNRSCGGSCSCRGGCATKDSAGKIIPECKLQWNESDWSGWYGICSAQDFLDTPDAQLLLMMRYTTAIVNAGVPAMAPPNAAAAGSPGGTALGAKIWDAATRRPFMPGSALEACTYSAGAAVALSHGFGSGAGDISGGPCGVQCIMDASTMLCPTYATPCDACNATLDAATCATDMRCAPAGYDPSSAIWRATVFPMLSAGEKALVNNCTAGDAYCGPFGPPPSPGNNTCIILMPKREDGAKHDGRERICEMAGVGDGVLQMPTSPVQHKDGKPACWPGDPACTLACNDDNPPPLNLPTGRPDLNTPPARPDALTEVYAAVVGFTLAWIILMQIIRAFYKKMPTIARDLTLWQGLKDVPVLGGVSGDTKVMMGQGWNRADQAIGVGGKEGASSYYTMEGLAVDSVENLAGTFRGRTTRPDEMGYTYDGQPASKAQGGTFKHASAVEGLFGGAGTFVSNLIENGLLGHFWGSSRRGSRGPGSGALGGRPASVTRGKGNISMFQEILDRFKK